VDLLTELGSDYGVEGQAGPSQFFDEMWPGYALGPEDWSGPTLNLTWSGTGPTLASVSGHAATPVSRGNFATVSPLAAVDRLASGLWWGSPAPLYYSGFDSVFTQVLPLDDYPEPGDVITLTVESAEQAPLLVWDASGTAWLVPGYIMRYGSEPWNASAVISLQDGVIELPEPIMMDTMPLPEGEQS
jgi:hypothetical protein